MMGWSNKVRENWNDERERERERERWMLFDSIVSWVTKENKIIAIAKPKRAQLLTLLRKTYDHNTSFSFFFKEQN